MYALSQADKKNKGRRSMTSSSPLWPELPPELLGLIASRISGVGMEPSAADLARFRAVCRSWHRAVRDHAPPPRRLPWVVFPNGEIFTTTDGDWHHITPFPKNAVCIGSTDAWLALDCTDADKRHTYLLHNPFTGRTVPLPEVGAVIGTVPKSFQIRKVLVRSTPDDLVVFMTDRLSCPIILIRPGKGMWLPKPQATTFSRIIDVAFLGDILHGITQAEDLVSLHVAFDGDGVPMVTGVERVIRHPVHDDDSDEWSDEDDNDGECEEEANDEDGGGDNDDALNTEGDDDNTLNGEGEDDDDRIVEAIEYKDDGDYLLSTLWYFVESRGKLLMVRRQLQWPACGLNCTLQVHVFEANIDTGVWVPVEGGFDGHAIFISRLFCKSVPAYGEEMKENMILFIDTSEVFNNQSCTITPSLTDFNLYSSTWLFSPKLVV